MINILNFGKYIFYERCHPVLSSDGFIDTNVHLVTDYDQVKNNKLGIIKEVMERLLKNNSDLFVYFEDGVPLGMMWGHHGSCYIRGPGIQLNHNKDTVYWFWVYTLPEARGKNVYNKLKHAFFTHYGSAKLYTALVDINNSIMNREMAKLGFISVKLYSFFKLLNTTLIIEKCNKTGKTKKYIVCGNKDNLLII